MDIKDYLAVYGAVVSTGTVLWNVGKWFVSRKLMTVELSNVDIYQPGRGTSYTKVGPIVLVKAINNSDHTLRIGSVSLGQENSPKRLIITDGLPLTVSPHDAGPIPFPESAVISRLDPSKPIIAYVSLTNGKTYSSKPMVISALPVAKPTEPTPSEELTY